MFHTATNELDAKKFITFLGIICPLVNLFGAVFMKVVPPVPIAEDDLEVPNSPISQLLHLDEHTPLLIGGPGAARQEAEAEALSKEHKWTAMKLVKDWEGFWAFGVVLALCIGPVSILLTREPLSGSTNEAVVRDSHRINRIIPHFAAPAHDNRVCNHQLLRQHVI